MRTVCLLLLVCGLGAAESRIDQVLTALRTVTEFAEVAISPDGKRVAYVEKLKNADGSESSNKAIFVADLSDGKAKRIGADGKNAADEHGIAWSPDSSQLAFFSDREKHGQLQLYVSGFKGQAKRLTSLTGYLADVRWAPDGRQLAVLFTENAPRAAGPLEPATRDAGVVEEKFYEQRLTLVDAASKAVRTISPADTYVYEYDWSPDSKRLVYSAAKGNGDNNWWIAELFTIDAGTGAITHLLKPELQVAVPRFSPDGKSIAFIQGIMSDEGITGGDVFVAPAEGGEARNLTPGRKASANAIDWTKNGRILVTDIVDGGMALTELNPASGETETLWKGDEALRAGDSPVSVAVDGRTVAAVRMSFSLAPEVWAGRIGEWKSLTHANAGQKPMWGKAEKLHWTTDGGSVQGWLVYPEGYDPAKRYPLVVAVHGGPAGAKLPGWPTRYDLTLLSGAGYFVLQPNPRGSYGAGEQFTKANVKDFGYGDLRDILGGVDQVLKTLPVDERRVGVTGWSYGGYMTMFAVTQTNRFRAAVAGAGLSNWQSYYGENLIDQWMIPYFGASVYDDPAVYAKSSPMTFIRNVKTPTLVVVGDSDAECPAPQSYEFWHGLKTLGVKTQLVVYPNEGHRFHDPKHVQDVMRRTIEWFDTEMK